MAKVTNPATDRRVKTYHKWTPEEDQKLLKEVESNRKAFETIGQPGGIPRDVFWGQIPGRLQIMATPLACAMRYRSLTHHSVWAKQRRKDVETTPQMKLDFGAVVDNRVDPWLKLSVEMGEIKSLLKQLLDVWVPPTSKAAQRRVQA